MKYIFKQLSFLLCTITSTCFSTLYLGNIIRLTVFGRVSNFYDINTKRVNQYLSTFKILWTFWNVAEQVFVIFVSKGFQLKLFEWLPVHFIQWYRPSSKSVKFNCFENGQTYGKLGAIFLTPSTIKTETFNILKY